MISKVEWGLHILRRHLFLVLSEGVHPTERYVGVSDIMLTGWEELQFVAFLEDGTIIGGNIKAVGE